MSIHRLPDTLSLYHDGPQVFRAQHGQLVAQTPLAYPRVYASLHEITVLIRAQGSEFPVSRSNKWPVAVDERGPWTDERWWVFQWLTGRQFDSDLLSVLKAIKEHTVPWDLTCPALEGEKTLMGRLLALYGEHTGARPNEPGFNPTQAMSNHPLADLLDGRSAEELCQFSDGGRTLVDVASTHQQWDVAEAAWNLGVRWSTEQLESGRALESILVSWMNLRGSPREGWLKSSTLEDTGQARVEWLDRWLGRFEDQGVAMPATAKLDRRCRAVEASGTKPKPFLDTPATLFAAHMFPSKGAYVETLDKMSPFARQMLDHWLDFWARNGVDLDAIAIPKVVVFANDPDQTITLRERWKDVPQLEGVLVKARFDRLENNLGRPSSQPAVRPRL